MSSGRRKKARLASAELCEPDQEIRPPGSRSAAIRWRWLSGLGHNGACLLSSRASSARALNSSRAAGSSLQRIASASPLTRAASSDGLLVVLSTLGSLQCPQ